MNRGLRTTIVGSWWPQPDAGDSLHAMHRGRLTAEEGENLLRRCAEQAIREQRDLGLTEWTGGEYFTDEFLNHMQKVLTGIVIDRPSKEELFDYDDFAHAKIEGTISAPNGLGYLNGYLRECCLGAGCDRKRYRREAHDAMSSRADTPAPDVLIIEYRSLFEAHRLYLGLDDRRGSWR